MRHVPHLSPSLHIYPTAKNVIKKVTLKIYSNSQKAFHVSKLESLRCMVANLSTSRMRMHLELKLYREKNYREKTVFFLVLSQVRFQWTDCKTFPCEKSQKSSKDTSDISIQVCNSVFCSLRYKY